MTHSLKQNNIINKTTDEKNQRSLREYKKYVSGPINSYSPSRIRLYEETKSALLLISGSANSSLITLTGNHDLFQ